MAAASEATIMPAVIRAAGRTVAAAKSAATKTGAKPASTTKKTAAAKFDVLAYARASS